MDMGIASAVIITIATISFITNMARKADPERMALMHDYENNSSMLSTFVSAAITWAIICLVPILVLAGF